MNRVITRPRHAITTALTNTHATSVHEHLTQRTNSKGRSFATLNLLRKKSIQNHKLDFYLYTTAAVRLVTSLDISRRRAPSYGQSMPSAQHCGRHLNTPSLRNSTSGGRFREERRLGPTLEG
ncbi:hypothetical protein HPB50_010356 [Hyalomma asiaticum]|uniref:Uncharacterized protein n=1 Tax=Hyalomma asiaticum TaxID=266040 RepID=A0ACB7RZU8_HYAAI|nr:hypothetical protein HPB50_010356 [Hyalomma asiaticum]